MIELLWSSYGFQWSSERVINEMEEDKVGGKNQMKKKTKKKKLK